jgi:hypothetical protein
MFFMKRILQKLWIVIQSIDKGLNAGVDDHVSRLYGKKTKLCLIFIFAICMGAATIVNVLCAFGIVNMNPGMIPYRWVLWIICVPSTLSISLCYHLADHSFWYLWRSIQNREQQ